MSGKLFIVATPIGNLDDITLRAIATLREVDLVAAEDTRHSQQLLNHLGIRQRLLSLHEHNERQRVASVIAELERGKNVALVSDAGTPLISDPGYPLLIAVIDAGFQVVPVPGVSSVITALSAAGLPTDRFSFHGFLSHRKAERLRQLQQLRGWPGTHILFESTHRIESLLQQINELIPAARLVLAKELTKRFERFIRGSARSCLDQMRADPDLFKGEFVVLLKDVEEADRAYGLDVEELLARLLQDLPINKAARLAADISGRKKNDLYQLALTMAQENN